MLSSAFRNLLENAVRHNDHDHPEITVSCRDAGGSVQVLIADDGPGVPDEQKEQIFGKGEKGLDSPGSGIGLYLVSLLTDGFGLQIHKGSPGTRPPGHRLRASTRFKSTRVRLELLDYLVIPRRVEASNP